MRFITLFITIFSIIYFNYITNLNAYNIKYINVHNSIVKLQPNIDKTFVKKITHDILKYSKQYNLDPHLLIAIINQESKFNMDAKNCSTGFNNKNKKVKVCHDFGLIQLNHTNITNMDINIKKLMTNSSYAINIMAKILFDLKKSYSKKEPQTFWTRYNTNTSYKRYFYQKAVCRYYLGGNYCKKIKTFDWKAN